MTALQLNVSGLLKETAGAGARLYARRAPRGPRGPAGRGAPGGPLRGDLRLMRTPRSIFVRGRLETRVAVECNRCLDELELPLELDVEAEFFPEIDISTGHALPAPDDDLAFSIDHNHELDLQEVVRQNLLLALPMQALCSEACQGLCPQCGHNLNRGPCEHVGQVTDERLASLASLFPRAAQR